MESRPTPPEQPIDFTTYRELEAKAFALVAEKSVGEMRFASPIPNQPYWTHLAEVHMAQIVDGVIDHEELLATILHDIVEDSEVTEDYVATEFSPRVAAIVGLCTKPEAFEPEAFYGKIMNADESIALPAMRIKVHDRINNLITNMAHNQHAKAREYATEARQYFMPMAERVGLVEELQRAIHYVEQMVA